MAEQNEQVVDIVAPELSYQAVPVNVSVNKRSVQNIIGIEIVGGLSIDYQTYFSKHSPKVVKFLTEDGCSPFSIDFHLARLGLWLNKSASNKRYSAKFVTKGKKYTLNDFTRKLGIDRATKESAEDKLTVNRLRRCLMPHVAALMRMMDTGDDLQKLAASKFRVLDNVPIEFSFPESYLVVPYGERDKFVKSVLNYEASWNDVSVKGRWSYKALQFFKDKKPIEFFDGELVEES